MLSSEGKRMKYDESQTESDEDDELDDVVLDSDEEQEHEREYYDPQSLSSDRSTPSPEPGAQQPNQAQPPEPGPKSKLNPTGHAMKKRAAQLTVPSHGALLKFLHRKEKTGSFPTCLWNKRKAEEVYALFNVTTSIVPTNYFLASEEFPRYTTANILNNLEQYPTSWSSVKEELHIFLKHFEGFESLADNFKKPDIAGPLIADFKQAIKEATKLENQCHSRPGWYSVFTNMLNMLEVQTCCESIFVQHVAGLLNQLSTITGGNFSLSSIPISLNVPAQMPYPELKLPVKPDFIVLASTGALMLVGEVKKFGSHGALYEEYRGNRVKEDQPDTNKPQGQGDQLPLTMQEDQLPPIVQGDQLPPTLENIDRCSSTRSMSAAVEPLARTSTGKTGSDTKRDTKRKRSNIPSRSLDSREKCKVDCYLPQLFGQMLAALHHNTNSTIPLANCTATKKVQLGFAVEGFKLRFVKLSLYDHINRSMNPTVEKLLTGKQLKCDIAMTREYNLLKRRHLEMFYQMCLAIDHMYR